MSSSNSYKPPSYYYSHPLSEDLPDVPSTYLNVLSGLPPGQPPYPMHGWDSFRSSTGVPNGPYLPNDSQLIEGQSQTQLQTAFDFLSQQLGKPTQSPTFETNILKELKLMREEMANIKKSIEEMPIRFADALTQCLESVNSRSETDSVDSEPEIIDILDKIESLDDNKEDNDLFEFTDKCVITSIESQNKAVAEKCDSIDAKFVFEYNPYIDLDKWLKKD